MSLKDKFRSLWSNIVIKRGPEEIVGRKTFYFTNGTMAFCIGFVLGLVVLILQQTMTPSNCDLATIIIVCSILALAVAGNIWYLLPLFRSNEKLWIKIVRPILGIVLFTALFVLGIYAFIALLLICAFFVALRIAIWAWGSGMSSPSSSSPKPNYDVQLGDGTKLKQTDFGGYEFKGDDGHHYTREVGDHYTRTD